MKNIRFQGFVLLALSCVILDPIVCHAQTTALTRLYMKSGTGLDRIVPTGASVQSTAGLYKHSASVTSSGFFKSGSSGSSSGSASSTSPGSGGGSASVANYTPSGSNTALVVLIGSVSTGTNAITAVSFGATSLTKVGQTVDASNRKLEFWSLLTPAASANVVSIAWPAAQTLEYTASVILLQDVDPVTPFGPLATATNLSPSSTIDITSGPGDIIIDAVAMKDNAVTAGVSQTTIVQAGTNSVDVASSYKSASTGAVTTTNMSWSAILTSSAAAGIAVKGQSNDAIFTLASPLCSGFTVKSGATITVKAYGAVTLGTVAGATIPFEAMLSYGSTTIATLFSASNSGLGALNSTGTLTWTGTIPADVAVPSGQSLKLSFFSDYQTADIRIDYDDATHISYAELPTNTYVNIPSLAIYDLAYPAGTVILSQQSGLTTNYIRADVTDPFGPTDITGLTLTFNGANAQAGILVNASGCTKTFQYAWTPGSGTPSFTVAATASQGTEGTVTATTNSSFSILPVNGLEVNVTPEGSAMRVDWSTLQESSTSHYVIERAIASSGFRPVGQVVAAGYSVVKRTYQWKDGLEGVPVGMNLQYRLRQVDLDGKYSYSRIVTIRSQGGADFGVKPNPFQDHLVVHLGTVYDGASTELFLADAFGRTVARFELQLQKGDHDYRIEGLGSLPGGIYYLRVCDPHGGKTYKVLKPGR